MTTAKRCHSLTQYASPFARVALENVLREYPNKPDHLLTNGADLRAPRELHPAFYGSYDWHSSVHMHWLLARLLRYVPELDERTQVHEVFDLHFSAENIAIEASYLRHSARRTFERPYGWAWLLKLQAELHRLAASDESAAKWRDNLQPLADAVVDGFQEFLPLAQYPVRAGTHANSAFSLILALDYADAVQHLALRRLVAGKASAWFGRDRRYPAAYEPGGDDFLSAGLVEAALMLRLVDGCSYADWWELFCPLQNDLATWLLPVSVADRSDPKLVHLDGVNLSRAWCWKTIRPQLDATLRARVDAAIEAHLDASLPGTVSGDYAGTHWLASFALLALTEG
ncbi:DUF2891 domain-containing protein [Noviherbaspirillum sp. ST9]|uniref:DUF2891 domain-containing protein n=1 Tax=Noviherbaspirillum sp. ST9 TaxID=3401606 RepID=UPI003B589ECC